MQREMEQEGKEYGDKDTFLTSAYRKKLEERRELEEELKIEAQRESKHLACCQLLLELVLFFSQRQTVSPSKRIYLGFTGTCWMT